MTFNFRSKLYIFACKKSEHDEIINWFFLSSLIGVDAQDTFERTLVCRIDFL